MCGGRGTRLDRGSDDGEGGVEKPLVEVGGVAMVERVLAALRASRVETVYLITSPHVPDTRDRLASLLDACEAGDDDPLCSRATILDAPGEGYVSDLGYALDRVSSPTLTVACDLPLLAPAVIHRVLDRAEDSEGSRVSFAVYVPVALKRRLGTSTDATWERGGRTLAPTGLNVVARDRGTRASTAGDDRRIDTEATDTDAVHVSYDARLAVNVNRPADLAVAEALCE